MAEANKMEKVPITTILFQVPGIVLILGLVVMILGALLEVWIGGSLFLFIIMIGWAILIVSPFIAKKYYC